MLRLPREPSEDGQIFNYHTPTVTSKLHRTMEIRKHLARNANWPGPASNEAISVATSIGIVFDTFFPADQHEEDRDLSWHFRAVDGQMINFKLTLRTGKWGADAAEIEAVLSLWLFAAHVEDQRKNDTSGGSLENDDKWLRTKGAPKRRNLWFRAPYTRTSSRDFEWWMSHIALKVVEKRCADSADSDPDDDHASIAREVHPWAVGLTGPGFSNQPELSSATFYYKTQYPPSEFDKGLEETSAIAVISDAPLKLLFAQNLFSFMLAAAAYKSRKKS